MSQRLVYTEFRNQLGDTRYPFAENASLRNDAGDVVLPEILLDAALFPIGGRERMYLSLVTVTHETVTLTIGDGGTRTRASGEFSVVAPPTAVLLTDSFGRPAGTLVSEPSRLAIFQSWDVGEHEFTVAQTEFATTVCFPTPEIGVRGVQLADGTLFTGDVWLLGDDGVVLRHTTALIADEDGNGVEQHVIRIDIVGDPLFRRRLCGPNALFTTPRTLRKLGVVHPGGSFEVTPDDLGNVRLSMNTGLTSDPVLRLRTTPSGVLIEAVGTPIVAKE